MAAPSGILAASPGVDAMTEFSGVVVLHASGGGAYDGGGLRIVTGWDGVDLVWAWCGGDPLVERSRAVCRLD